MNANVWFDMQVKGNAWRIIWTFAVALLRRQPSVRITINNATVNVTDGAVESRG